MRDFLLQSKDLAIGYEKNIVADGISFSLKPGTVTALLGPNGAGKSTLLKTISGRIAALGGTVYLLDRELVNTDRKTLAKSLSVMTTKHPETELFTCFEVVCAGRYPYTDYLGRLTDEDRAAVYEALALTDSEALAERDFSLLSDGQKQRVLLARAIAQETDVLVLDEPISFLDVKNKIAFLEMLKTLVQKRRVAAILSMHELTFAKSAADYVLCMKDGQLLRAGTSAEIFEKEFLCKLFSLSSESYDRYF